MTGRRCPICESNNVHTFLRRLNVPVHQNLVYNDRQSAVATIRGNITMAFCNHCGFVFNADFDESLLTYNDDYDNTQMFSTFFQKYLTGLVEHILDKKSVENRKIIEVGCGNGLFLRKLIKNGPGNSGYGFDPSYCGPLSELDGKLRFAKHNFGIDYQSPEADIVICRHVIEHVADPISKMRDIRKALKASRNGQVFFETPCVEWILVNDVHFDMFYEHCSLFCEDSLKSAMGLAGFEVKETRHIFGGQYLWLEANPKPRADDPRFNPGKVPDLVREFAIKERRFVEFWKDKIDCVRSKPLAIWGAGAKGATFLNLIDPKAEHIDFAVDINPRKRGKFVSGTGHEVLGVDQIKSAGIKSAITINPNYAKENKAIIEDLHMNVEWI